MTAPLHTHWRATCARARVMREKRKSIQLAAKINFGFGCCLFFFSSYFTSFTTRTHCTLAYTYNSLLARPLSPRSIQSRCELLDYIIDEWREKDHTFLATQSSWLLVLTSSRVVRCCFHKSGSKSILWTKSESKLSAVCGGHLHKPFALHI